MQHPTILLITINVLSSIVMAAQDQFERDVLPSGSGEIAITFLGHGTLMLTWREQTIHIDPYSKVADYAKLPKADVIFLTHEHRDHLDPQALELIRTDDTIMVLTETCAKTVTGGIVMNNGDSQTIAGIKVEAVPAYNVVHQRADGQPYHPKGIGNGYVLTFGDTRLYVAGDTENIPEMKALKNIDCAFLPMNLPYTMTPAMVADAAKAFRPNILYPYHYGDTDVSELTDLLKNEQGIEVRVRKMQ